MYLLRRSGEEGIFQATAFINKPKGRKDLRSGAYFISLDVRFCFVVLSLSFVALFFASHPKLHLHSIFVRVHVGLQAVSVHVTG